MQDEVFRVDNAADYRKAGPNDLIQLLPAPETNAIFLPKQVLEAIVYAIHKRKMVHLSGPTGSAKTSVIEALYLRPQNFRLIAEQLGLSSVTPVVYPIEMVQFEAPNELFMRRALENGSTYDEDSVLIRALKDAQDYTNSAEECPCVWLREMGRVHSAAIQGGLLDLVTNGEITIHNGTRLSGQHIAWIADSNYQAEEDSVHTLVTFDDALKRRFATNVTLDYLTAEQEALVLHHLTELPTDHPTIFTAVRLGQAVREQRREGNLLSVPPPSIYGYMDFVDMVQAMPHMELQQVAYFTMLGNSSNEDRKHAATLCGEIFGVQVEEDDDVIGGIML